jgi:preprotein translocase subunit SecB
METNEPQAPHISVNAQYIKDLSFENPGAPGNLVVPEKPQIDLALDLNINKLPDQDYYEVEIIIDAKAESQGNTMFIVDLKYAGVFNLINIPEDQISAILAVHCPALIFPYARKIIADVTQDGGFQPLMLDPIDFGALYTKKISEEKTDGAARS